MATDLAPPLPLAGSAACLAHPTFAPCRRHAHSPQVNSTAKLAVGQLVGLHYNGGNGTLAREM